MKRFVIVVVMVAIIIGAGFVSLFQLSHITKEMEAELVTLASLVEEKSGDLQERTLSFQQFWEEKEQTLMRYVHHDELDTITGTVARLSALARYEDYGELAAEIDRLRRLVQHIYESESPSFHSIF